MDNHSLSQLNLEISSKIYHIRGMQVMLDFDLASIYNVETKVLNQTVKRNLNRFPSNFRFQLNENETNNLRSQFVTSSWGGKRYLPYAFTEQGISMLSAVLKSDTAVEISIQIMSTFVEMRKFILSNAQLFQRIETIEQKQISTDQQISIILNVINQQDIKPKQGIFFDGQIFDAYTFASDLIRSANKSIILIDNYIDDTVLTLLTKRNPTVSVKVYTKKISKQLQLDNEKHNSQYPAIEIIEFSQSHDRFLIIDEQDVYHFGASLKDLGKKWFAFSKFDTNALSILQKL